MIDPVCVFHGKRRSEHECLVCCLCFKTLTREECSFEPNGDKVDICVPCAETERALMVEKLHERSDRIRALENGLRSLKGEEKTEVGRSLPGA